MKNHSLVWIHNFYGAGKNMTETWVIVSLRNVRDVRFYPYTGEHGSVKTRILVYFMLRLAFLAVGPSSSKSWCLICEICLFGIFFRSNMMLLFQKFFFKPISNHIETIQFNCNPNQMTGFYTSERYALNGVKGIIHVNLISTFSPLASAKD